MSAQVAEAGIVVGLDGSPPAQAAVAWGAREAGLRGLPLTLLHVVDDVLVQYTPGNLEDLEPPARLMLQQAADRAMSSQPLVPVRVEVTAGSPGQELVAMSRSAAMLVLGSRGLGGFRELITGSVALRVVHHAHCPVVLVRPQHADVPRRGVVVGVDGSEAAEDALAFAFPAAEVRSVPLTVVMAWTYPVQFGVDVPAVVNVESLERTARATLDEAIERWAPKFTGVGVDRRLVCMPPAQALLDISAEAELLVVGSRGRSTLTDLILGSVSHAVVHHAVSPVAVVRCEERR
jgi:nucleotide-binding universal stress UspA family protein